MRIRWKFWKRPVSPERLEELQRIVDEAEEGALIPMTRAEIKAFKPGPKGLKGEITIGDLFWDKDHAWCEGSNDLDMVHLVLSRDRCPEDGQDYWRLARFMWCTGSYCGANIWEATDDCVLKMTKVGNIAEIKAFASEAKT